MKRYTAVISTLAKDCAEKLAESFDVLLLPPDETIAPPVSTHPDMLMFILGDTVVLPEEYYREYPRVVETLHESTSAEVILSNAPRSTEYPLDVSLNVLVCGDVAMGRGDFIASEVKELVSRKGLRLVHTKQGYAACSSLALGNSVISADRGIISACKSEGLPCLEVSQGHVRLEGYDTGFIGGASGVCENTVYFLGNIMRHPDSEKILEFLKTQGYSAVSLSDGELCDFGGIKFIRNRI